MKRNGLITKTIPQRIASFLLLGLMVIIFSGCPWGAEDPPEPLLKKEFSFQNVYTSQVAVTNTYVQVYSDGSCHISANLAANWSGYVTFTVNFLDNYGNPLCYVYWRVWVNYGYSYLNETNDFGSMVSGNFKNIGNNAILVVSNGKKDGIEEKSAPCDGQIIVSKK